MAYSLNTGRDTLRSRYVNDGAVIRMVLGITLNYPVQLASGLHPKRNGMATTVRANGKGKASYPARYPHYRAGYTHLPAPIRRRLLPFWNGE